MAERNYSVNHVTVASGTKSIVEMVNSNDETIFEYYAELGSSTDSSWFTTMATLEPSIGVTLLPLRILCSECGGHLKRTTFTCADCGRSVR